MALPGKDHLVQNNGWAKLDDDVAKFTIAANLPESEPKYGPHSASFFKVKGIRLI